MMGPETDPGDQVILYVEPATSVWSVAGEYMTSKPEVWATTEETRAKIAAEMIEERMVENMRE